MLSRCLLSYCRYSQVDQTLPSTQASISKDKTAVTQVSISRLRRASPVWCQRLHQHHSTSYNKTTLSVCARLLSKRNDLRHHLHSKGHWCVRSTPTMCLADLQLFDKLFWISLNKPQVQQGGLASPKCSWGPAVILEYRLSPRQIECFAGFDLIRHICKLGSFTSWTWQVLFRTMSRKLCLLLSAKPFSAMLQPDEQLSPDFRTSRGQRPKNPEWGLFDFGEILSPSSELRCSV